MTSPPKKPRTRIFKSATPQEWLAEIKPQVEPLLGAEAGAAFPVVRRQPMGRILAPGIIAMAMLLVAGFAVPGDEGETLFSLGYLLITPLFLLGVLLQRRSNEYGVVVASQTEYAMFRFPKSAGGGVELVERIDRTTPLPRVRTHRRKILGGPVPFEQHRDDGSGWHYSGFTAFSGNDYRRVINELRRGESRMDGADAQI